MSFIRTVHRQLTYKAKRRTVVLNSAHHLSQNVLSFEGSTLSNSLPPSLIECCSTATFKCNVNLWLRENIDGTMWNCAAQFVWCLLCNHKMCLASNTLLQFCLLSPSFTSCNSIAMPKDYRWKQGFCLSI